MARPAFALALFVPWCASPRCSSGTLNVPRHTAQVARPFICDLLSLACHAWLLKWHAPVIFKAGVPRLRYQVARPWLKWWVRCAKPSLACHAPSVAFIVALWKIVLACHAQILACHAHVNAWRILSGL
ncbi:hypothetical protein AHAS_Ahas19G0218200 [Arachis hypogaea]